MIEVAQQLSWLTASVRLPIDGQVSFSDSVLIRSDAETDVAIFKIFPLSLNLVPKIESSCWLPLLLGTVIARNYPIPAREQERGLELPFDLMAAVAGDMTPKCRDGGIYLKGYSRLLYPVSGTIPGSVQWHLLTSSSRRVRLPDNLICDQIWMRILDTRLLSSIPRTFLGYCREVIIDLGTNKTADHYKEIMFSSAEDAIQGPRVQAPSSFTWGTSGMGLFGATFTQSIVYGKALAQTVTGNNDDYFDVLDNASETPIILYDDTDNSRRGWMITASILILHMIRTWAAEKNCFQSSLPGVPPQLQSEEATRSVLKNNWDFVVRSSSNENMCKNMTVKDLVMQFWHGIQRRYTEDLCARHQLEPGIELTSPKLYGWDYMELVTGRASRKKQLEFNGNWIDLTEVVTVLFGGGFGDVIKPAPAISVCAEWNPIPTKKMHLTVTIDCVQKLSRMRGHPYNLQFSKLTNRSYWNHPTSSQFTDCTDCCSSTSAPPIRCPKMLQALDSRAQKSTQGLILPPKGAIVFGQPVSGTQVFDKQQFNKQLMDEQPQKLRPWRSSKKHLSKITSRMKSQVQQLAISEPVPQSSCPNKHENGFVSKENLPENGINI